MKFLSTILFISVLLFALLIPGVLRAQNEMAPGLMDQGPEQRLLYSTETVEWQAAPPSLESGAEVAVLEGNPGEPGVFTMRIKMPDEFYISPHWHPGVERVTVISGLLHLGNGEELNRDTTDLLEPGSYTSMPPEFRHYAIAEGETVVQLTSVGPWEINYINPDDDPRLRA
jgi:quercetin dioxygenase-like cupin family protein